MPRKIIPASERFWPKVDKSGPGECWTWTAGRAARGRYGAFSLNKKTQVPAHVWSYEQVYGKVPKGLQVDHMCGFTLCVNPDHLEAVPPKVNVARSSLGIKQRSKTHCPQGHPYSAENTWLTKDRGRVCRACAAVRAKRHYAANLEARRAKQREYNRRRRAADPANR